MSDLKITLIQSELYWENKDKNLSMFTEKISSIQEETDLIVLPEMFTTGFSMQPSALAEKMEGPAMQWMHTIAKEKNCVVTGSLIIEECGSYYNRLIWMSKDGYKYYDKRHLFRLSGEEKVYTAGRNKITATIREWKVFPLICYDLRFPVWSRRTKASNYDVLIYVANWPERRVHAWKQLLIARAIENQCYTIGVNRFGNDGNTVFHSGDSAALDFKGEYLAGELPDGQFTKTITLHREPLDSFRKQFAFFEDSDDFEIKY